MLNSADLRELLPNPKDIVVQLDQYIIGQKDAKNTLALMLLNQNIMKLYYNNKIYLKSKLQKTNVLLIGPTGTGKTALMKALSDINNIPISINDVTSCTAAGYIGGKVEDILVNHVCKLQEYVEFEYDRLKESIGLTLTRKEFLVKLSETGVIYIDEIDKICSRHSGDGIDINGDMVQNELLKFLDSGIVNLQSSRNWWKCKLSSLNTQNILFVCGGAFEGLDKVISTRLSKEGSIGFNADISHKSLTKGDLLHSVTTDDLIKYGFKPEFLGRMPLRAVLDPISVSMMKRIILEPEDCLFKQYRDLLNLFGIQTEISKSGLHEMAVLATELGMGARSLKPIFCKLFEEVLLNLWEIEEDTTFAITKRDIQKIQDLV